MPDLDSVKITSLMLSSVSESATDENVSYDLSAFQCKWTLDTIPTAYCTIILGQDVLNGGAEVEWENPEPGGEWEVSCTASSFDKPGSLSGSTTEILFSGYILSYNESDNLTPYGTAMSITIALAGLPVILSTIESSAYTYWGGPVMVDNKEGEEKGAKAAVKFNIFSKDISAMLINDSVLKRINALTGYNLPPVTAAQGQLNQLLIGVAAYQYDIASEGEEVVTISDYFKADRKIGFKPDATEEAQSNKYDSVVSVSLAKAYMDLWTGASVWDAILGAARMFYLGIAPRRDGRMEIMPVTPWLLEPHFKIPRQAILGMEDSTELGQLLYSPDSVMVMAPLPNDKNALDPGSTGRYKGTYPDVAELKKKKPKGRVAKINLPYWASHHTLREQVSSPAPDTAPKDGPKPRTTDQAKKQAQDTKDAELRTFNKTKNTVTAFAQLYWAKRKNANRGVQIEVPWNRIALIDTIGYVVEIPDLSKYSDRAKQTIYGMIAGVTLKISRSATGGAAVMKVNLTHVRDKDTNDAYALKSNPFFSFDFASEATQLSQDIGIVKSTELNLDSRLGPAG
jgi:hypothetical protein